MHKLSIVAVFLGGAALAEPNVIVEFGTPTVTGTVDAKALAAVVTSKQAELAACHRKAFAKVPVRSGTVITTFKIASDGKVTVTAATGLGDELGACLSATISRLAFGKPGDGKPVTVTYPLAFRLSVRALGSTGGGSGTVPTLDGGLMGTEVGEMEGGSHLDRSGSSAPGVSGGPVGMAARTAPEPTISLGELRVTGDLPKDIIRRYLKRNLQRLRYCYEKQLAATPTLAGTVTAEFTIGADGRVDSSKASGLKNPEAETCIATVIKAIEFPRPKSGAVTVRAPLTLRSPGPRPAPAKPAPAKPAPAKAAPAPSAPEKPAPEKPAPAPSK